MKFGVYLHGVLMESYDSEKEAGEAARFALQETGIFHEVKIIEKGRGSK